MHGPMCKFAATNLVRSLLKSRGGCPLTSLGIRAKSWLKVMEISASVTQEKMYLKVKTVLLRVKQT